MQAVAGFRWSWRGLVALIKACWGRKRRAMAGKSAMPPRPTQAIKPPLSTARRRLGPEPLLPETIVWVRGLPREMRPLHVVKYFPHVANQLFLTWNSPEYFDRYVRNLMLDTRGGRQGFPPAVASELADLYEYHSILVFPKARDPWDRNHHH